jgi:hypothetical protein
MLGFGTKLFSAESTGAEDFKAEIISHFATHSVF